jgi:hypothetical protein
MTRRSVGCSASPTSSAARATSASAEGRWRAFSFGASESGASLVHGAPGEPDSHFARQVRQFGPGGQFLDGRQGAQVGAQIVGQGVRNPSRCGCG